MVAATLAPPSTTTVSACGGAVATHAGHIHRVTLSAVTQLSGSFSEALSGLEVPKSAQQVMARRYGLMTFDLSKVLANSLLTTGLEGVVWQLMTEDRRTTTFVPQVGGCLWSLQLRLGWSGLLSRL